MNPPGRHPNFIRRTDPIHLPTVTGLMDKEIPMGKKNRQAVSLTVVRAVLASYLVGDDNLGIDGGEFANRLIRLIAIADDDNRAMLATLYPDYVAAVAAVGEPWGIDWLRKRALEVA